MCFAVVETDDHIVFCFCLNWLPQSPTPAKYDRNAWIGHTAEEGLKEREDR
jgi:hypothetical protein